jgi:predicted deacylase
MARGVVALGGEFGGAGAVSRSGVALVERGIRNLLAYAGVIERPAAAGWPAASYITTRDTTRRVLPNV